MLFFIPINDDLSSLSAILLNDDNYHYMLENSALENGLHRAKEDNKQLRKHKGDVLRLTVMLTENDIFELPESIKTHLQNFMNAIEGDLAGKEIFKEMGLGSIVPENVYQQIIKSFKRKV